MRLMYEKWKSPNKKIIDDGWEGEEITEWEKHEKSSFLTPIISSEEIAVWNGIYTEDDFNLWMVYSDFILTPKFLLAVAEQPGVETVDPISRYRFRVGVGKLFAPNKVLDTLIDKANEIYGDE